MRHFLACGCIVITDQDGYPKSRVYCETHKGEELPCGCVVSGGGALIRIMASCQEHYSGPTGELAGESGKTGPA